MKKIFLILFLIFFPLSLTAQEKWADFTTNQLEIFETDKDIVKVPVKIRFELFADSLVVNFLDKGMIEDLKKEGKPPRETLVHPFTKKELSITVFYIYESPEYSIKINITPDSTPIVTTRSTDQITGYVTTMMYSTSRGR